MEQNVRQCDEFMKRIKKRLDDLGYISIMSKNNILVKASKYSRNKTGLKISMNVTSNCKCRGSIIDESSGCPYKVSCNVSKEDCPLNNKECNCTPCNPSTGSTNKFTGDYDCLFRIRPSDIQNGIVLYAIILHGETCELKMIFDHTKAGEQEIIDTLQFLV